MDVLQSAQARVDAVLNTINGLKRGTFPQDDSQEAIGAIKRIFEDQKSIIESLGPQDSKSVVDNHCNSVLRQMFHLLPVLGFLHRSKNPTNAFEVYGPLRHLAFRLISPQTRLVLSSEWDYSPYTYLQIPELPRYVLIGVPASESPNVLLTPVAGHEFGHTIWANERGAHIYEAELVTEITHAIGVDWTEFARHFPSVPDAAALTTDLFALQTWAPALQWSLSQCEELFCDFIGLRVFGMSYLHAFGFLLAPGMATWKREPEYPTVRQRVEYMVSAAPSFGIVVRPATWICLSGTKGSTVQFTRTSHASPTRERPRSSRN